MKRLIIRKRGEVGYGSNSDIGDWCPWVGLTSESGPLLVKRVCPRGARCGQSNWMAQGPFYLRKQTYRAKVPADSGNFHLAIDSFSSLFPRANSFVREARASGLMAGNRLGDAENADIAEEHPDAFRLAQILGHDDPFELAVQLRPDVFMKIETHRK